MSCELDLDIELDCQAEFALILKDLDDLLDTQDQSAQAEKENVFLFSALTSRQG